MNRVLSQTQSAGGALRSQGLGSCAGQLQCTTSVGYCQGYTQLGYFGWQQTTR